MTNGELRGNSREGYRGRVECPHCQRLVHLSAQADLVRKVMVIWPVQRDGAYTPADLASLDYAREHGAPLAGMPQAPGHRGRLPVDPVPAWDGPKGS